jgi:glyoxylase-like metal-dependent hydrolase (beta-lactamase superfamily II)
LKGLLSADLVYSHAHLSLGEEHLESWLTRLDELKVLAKGKILTIYPGHGDAAGLERIGQTRAYLDDFAEAIKSGSPKAAEERMLAEYSRYHVRQFLSSVQHTGVFSHPSADLAARSRRP